MGVNEEWYMDGDSINYSSLEHFKLDVTRYLATRFKLEKPLNASGIKKVVINTCFGGYGLSEKVVLKFNEESGTKMSAIEASYKIPRDNDLLIRIIEEVGVEDAGGLWSNLKIIEIPDDIEFVISEYDGKEILHEKHRTWY